MKNELSLSADQVPKVAAANSSLIVALQKLIATPPKGSSPGEDHGFAQNARTAINNRETKLEQILTQSQWQKHNASSVARIAEIETSIMDLQLKLTDNQLPQVEQANFEACRKMQAVISGVGKNESATGREKLKSVKALETINAEHDRNLEKILSPEQWKNFLQWRGAIRELAKEKVAERGSR